MVRFPDSAWLLQSSRKPLPDSDHTGRVQAQLGKAVKLRIELIGSKHACFEGEVEGTVEWSVMVGPGSRDSTQLDRSDGRSSLGAGWKPSRYWDAAVPLADNSRPGAANEMSPSPSVSASSVTSEQTARHVHRYDCGMAATCRRGVQLG